MTEQYLKSGNGRLWIQEDGCLNEWVYWGCYAVGTITEPLGDKTLFYCPSSKNHNEYIPIASVKGAPGPITFSMETPLIVRTRLAEIACPFNAQIRFGQCTRPDDPTKWEQVFDFHNVDLTGRTYENMIVREPGDNTLPMVSADASADSLLIFRRLKWIEQGAAASVYKLNDVAFCDAPECGSECGVGNAGCQVGYVVGDGSCPGDAPLLKTSNGGGAWTDLGSPFTTGTDDITSICCDGDYVIVTNGTTASIAYSTDAGTTWNEVTTGFTGGVLNDCYLYSRQNIWVVGAGGYIYNSKDGGATWTIQEDGDITAQTFNEIHGYDDQIVYAVGNAGAMVKTIDGGKTWFNVTSPTAGNLYTVFAAEREVVFIGGAGGAWYSVDGGDNFTQITGVNTPVIGITFCGCNFGFMITGSPTLYRTIDGGKTWQTETTGAVANLYAVHCCNVNQVYAVGDNGQIKFGNAK